MSFMKMFPDDMACIDWLVEKRNPNGIVCKKCECVTKHHWSESVRAHACQECGWHYHVTAGTIFHGTRTSLVIWFYVVWQLSNTRGGVSAKAVERETGVTYKTAYRMCKLIRQQLDEGKNPLGGEDMTVEVGESYFGAKSKEGKRGRGSENKVPVIGLVERGGRIHTQVIDNVKKSTLQPIIEDIVEDGTTVMTDELASYNGVKYAGYDHYQIMHSSKVYVNGNVHTNTIEGFWGNFKMGVTGTHHHVSNKCLQMYLNEHGFRYNHRNDTRPMFLSMIDRMALPSDHMK